MSCALCDAPARTHVPSRTCEMLMPAVPTEPNTHHQNVDRAMVDHLINDRVINAAKKFPPGVAPLELPAIF